jgi:Transposase
MLDGMPYSAEFRQAVVGFVRQGRSQLAAAHKFGVSQSTVHKWLAAVACPRPEYARSASHPWNVRPGRTNVVCVGCKRRFSRAINKVRHASSYCSRACYLAAVRG